MRRWLIPLLQCVECRGRSLQDTENGVLCAGCGRQYETDRGVTSFFSQKMNATPQKELEAIQKLDDGSSPESLARLKDLLMRMDREGIEPSPDALAEFSCMQHVIESRKEIEELLRRRPISRERVTDPPLLLEIGADHCWASNLFLDRGCRVIALDISDHLHLASRGGEEDLCRMKADMNLLPLKNDSLDIVWATSAAHHSWDLQETFRESARVLKPGGQLFFCCEPIPSWIRYPFGHDFGHEERLLGINECWVSRSSWIRYCRKAGFDRVELLFPNFSTNEIRTRLRSRKLPQVFAPVLHPFLKAFQVSIHLVARKMVVAEHFQS